MRERIGSGFHRSEGGIPAKKLVKLSFIFATFNKLKLLSWKGYRTFYFKKLKLPKTFLKRFNLPFFKNQSVPFGSWVLICIPISDTDPDLTIQHFLRMRIPSH